MNWILSLLVIVTLTITSCTKEQKETGTLTLNFSGLPDLGSDYAYEGWLMVDGSPITAGVFTVDGSGKISGGDLEISESDLEAATAYILTIEPSPDPDPAPSAVHILAGDFSGNKADLSVAHSAAIGNDFSVSSGAYILATPTDGSENNEKSGVWFLDLSSGSPAAGLDLPAIPSGWRYEGWAVIDGQPVSTGTFTSGSKADAASPFSGSMDGPPFPGEDFLNNAPSGLSFPTDLSGGTMVISVEPYPDNSPAPFVMKPLVGGVPASAENHVTYMMENMSASNNPTGSVTK